VLEGSVTNPAIGVVDTSLCQYVRIGAAFTGLGNCETLAVTASEPKFQGALDEIQVYNHALTASDVGAMLPVSVPASAVLLVTGLGALAIGARQRCATMNSRRNGKSVVPSARGGYARSTRAR
jgi:hypothetical protein